MGGMHVYIPWWLWDAKNKDFPRGYHVEIGGGFGMPGMGSFAGECRRHEGYGKDLKDSIRNRYGANVGMAGRAHPDPHGESVARAPSLDRGPSGHHTRL